MREISPTIHLNRGRRNECIKGLRMLEAQPCPNSQKAELETEQTHTDQNVEEQKNDENRN